MNKKKLLLGVTASIMLAGAIVTAPQVTPKVEAARTDMVDTSNHNGYMTTSNFTAMRDQYGVKAVVTKISEGTYYHDYTAKNNISTAQQSGLYINGYHFARWSSVEGARAEANYAVAMAKADGLPINAVLVADVEAEQQQKTPKNINDLATMEFKRIVEQAGYRYDIYTSQSWKNNVVSVPDGTGWIAQYPYNVTADRHTQHHAWQWTSTMQFNGSYGNFDVSQLYDNYYTGDQNKNAVISNGDTVDVNNQTEAKNDSTPTTNATTSKDEDYAQNGVFTANTTLNVRTAPSTSAQVVAQYAPGESLTYDHVYIKGGYVWARYMSYSGSYHYVAMGVMGGQEYGTRRQAASRPQVRSYQVRSGDTLGAIARKLGTTVSRLQSMNGIRNVNLIYSGQVLRY
ncbi:GH25 family lysozyme [Ligilactobacillus apodemi]|uniref:GH25 family lysozyme n=1 Tax=Ligilactobacillus apodemi TaxID=307126 RepID=UPI00214C551C|nr:GH25 family lysozyme [Ligilactobacillus apodemi]MCR1900323.1 LysM peptidoglycan-binding domain-containing protein [Ligilactobacillus apodemi]